jgi:hypothetical protein
MLDIFWYKLISTWRNIYRHFGVEDCFCTVNMETWYFSETLSNLYQVTWSYKKKREFFDI